MDGLPSFPFGRTLSVLIEVIFRLLYYFYFLWVKCILIIDFIGSVFFILFLKIVLEFLFSDYSLMGSCTPSFSFCAQSHTP